MPEPRPPSDRALAKAADMRAAGASWEAVAVALRRAVAAVRGWPALDPDRWHHALRDAERRLLADAGAESVLVLRQLLRSDDEKVRRDAARALLALRLDHAKLDPPPTAAPDAVPLVTLLEARPDDRHPAARRPLPLPPRPVAVVPTGGDGPG